MWILGILNLFKLKRAYFKNTNDLHIGLFFKMFSLSTTPGDSRYRNQVSQQNIEEIIRTDRREANKITQLRNVTGGEREVGCLPPLDAETIR